MLELTGLGRLHVGPIDWSVAAGRCVCLMGASGAGKSVLLRMIADLDPHEGEMRLDGVAASSMPAPAWRARVSYVAANPGWWSPRVADHFPADLDPARFEAVGLARDAGAWPVARLSTGERQRLAVLRALRPLTRVLLLDEPTSGLDAASAALVEAVLRQAIEDGLAVVLVTHDAAQAARMAHARFVLAGGRLQEATR